MTNLPSNQEAIQQINMHFFLKSFAEKWGEQESELGTRATRVNPGKIPFLASCGTRGRKGGGKMLCLQFDTAEGVGGRGANTK